MIDKLLEQRETGNVFPGKNPVVSASLKTQDMGETMFPSGPILGVEKEYELQLKASVRFIANSAQLTDRRNHAVKQLKHELYNDMISDIYEAMNINGDFQVQEILSRMLSRIGI